MASDQKKQAVWAEAQRLCNLSAEEVRMAKELGFQPKSLINNRPSPTQQWKAPVRDWIRDLYEKKIGSRRTASPPSPPPAFRKPEESWPDKPEIPELVLVEKDLSWVSDAPAKVSRDSNERVAGSAGRDGVRNDEPRAVQSAGPAPRRRRPSSGGCPRI